MRDHGDWSFDDHCDDLRVAQGRNSAFHQRDTRGSVEAVDAEIALASRWTTLWSVYSTRGGWAIPHHGRQRVARHRSRALEGRPSREREVGGGNGLFALFSAAFDMTSISDRVNVFRRLHESGCFVIPNPWDIGSARALARLGFPALATTSSGYAWSLGRADNHVSLDEALAHVRAISNAVEIPVNADFEGGFATEPEGVGANVGRATRDRDRRDLHRGFHRRRVQSAFRLCPGGRAGPSGSKGHRRQRDRRPARRAAPKASSSGVPTSPKRSAGSPPTPKPAPTASTRRDPEQGGDRGGGRAPSLPSRSMCWSAATLPRWPSLPRRGSGGSASAARWPGRRGRGSSRPRERSRGRGPSAAWPGRFLSPR